MSPAATNVVPHPGQMQLSPATRAALLGGFVVIVALLVLMTVTLVSQRQRTVLLNRQLGALVGETTLVLRHAAPLLDALPAHSSTIATRARSAAALVAEARPVVQALSDSQLISQVRSLAATTGQSDLIPQLSSLATTARQSALIPRTLGGLRNLGALVNLEAQALEVRQATLQNARRSTHLTAGSLSTARDALSVAEHILSVAEQTLSHAADIDRKTGPPPPSGSGTIP